MNTPLVFAGTDEDALGLVTLATDDFTATDGTDLRDYTGGTGWVSGSTYVTTTAGALPTTGYFKIKSGIMTPVGTTSGGGYTLVRKLATGNEINLNTNMDYYIKFQTVVSETGKTLPVTSPNQSQTIRLARTATDLVGGGGPGIGTNNTIKGLSPYITLNNYYPSKALPADQSYTWLWHISARTATEDVMRVKVFGPNDTFTYTPDSWDSDFQTNSTSTYDGISLIYSNGAGSNNARPRFDNIAISKCAPVYVNKTGGNFTLTNPVVGETATISVDAKNIASNDQAIQSCDWYLDNESTPFLSGNSCTVTSDMVSKRLRCKVVVRDLVTLVDKTYWPIAAYVRDSFDIYSVSFTNTGSGNSLGPVVLNTSNQLDTTSAMAIKVVVSKNVKQVGGTVLGITAVYSSDGKLKSVSQGTLQTYTGGSSGTNASNTLYTYTPTSFAAGSFAAGDYVKLYVWNSISGLKPLQFNKNMSPSQLQFPAQ